MSNAIFNIADITEPFFRIRGSIVKSLAHYAVYILISDACGQL